MTLPLSSPAGPFAPSPSPSGARSGLTIVTSDRAEGLIERLAGDLGLHPLGPFDDELIVVQSQGMRRWLRHELARRHGCAASIQFPFPADFCRRLAAAPLGTRAIDARFDRNALTWRILELLEGGVASEPVFSPLARFIADSDGRKRLGLASRLASRLDDYQLYRPDTLTEWETAPDDSDTVPHVRWQAELWRRLCAGDAPPMHLARWFGEAIARLESASSASGLPRRISVFGVSTLPPLFVRLLHAAARQVPVRFYTLAPSYDGSTPRNPLFRAFGGTVRELLDILAKDALLENANDDDPVDPDCALRRLQHDVRHDIARGPERGLAPRIPLDASDCSVSVHVCHSPMREMEVLRDQLLAAFAADPSLRPHDILLLVPDVGAYAPFVEAVFGVGEPELPRIPYHVADRTTTQEFSVADAAVRILALVGARWTATEIVELLDAPAIRRAAGLADDANDLVLRWLRETRIRWARDGAMRRDQFGLPAVESNSWAAGIDRLLMGYATGSDDRLFAGVLPSSGAASGNPEALGAFVQWVNRLFDLLDDCRRPRPLAEWAHDLRAAFSTLIVADDHELDAFDQLLAVVDGLGDIEHAALSTRDVDIALVRDWLARELADDSLGSGFLVGGMTVCALKPMRSIPFKVIAVAGLDDAAFPRRNRRAAYDLLEIAPRKNDRDLRADDRQLFLDTLLSARDQLILSYVGRSARNNAVRAASVVIAELLDEIDRTFVTADGKPARESIVCEHKLQPFSAVYYASDAGNLAEAPTPKHFSFSRANARATTVAAADRRRTSAFITTDSASNAHDAGPLHVRLADLISCWINPSRFHAQRTLGIHLPGEEEPLDDCEPMAMAGLEKYVFDQRILNYHLAGERSMDRERDEALANGLLPSGELASRWIERLNDDLSPFLSDVGRPVFVEPLHIDVEGNTWTLSGRVDGLVDGGRIHARAAKRKPGDLVQAWITHVALAAAGRPVTTQVFGTDGSCQFGAVAGAMSILESLVGGYRAAVSSPIPVFEFASHEFVSRVCKLEKGNKPRANALSPIDAAISKLIGSEFGGPGDIADPYHSLCWRGRNPIAEHLADFEKWSAALWRPVLTAMTGGDAESDA